MPRTRERSAVRRARSARAGFSILELAIVLALLMATPITLFHAATVNTDASLLLCGSLGLLATLKYEQGRLAPWWLALTYVALLFVEPTNLLIAGTGCAYLLVRVSTRPQETLLRRVTPLVLVVGLAVLRLEVTSRLRRALFPRDTSVASEPLSSAPMFVSCNRRWWRRSCRYYIHRKSIRCRAADFGNH